MKYFVRWVSNGTWSSAIDVSTGAGATTWGPSAVSNATGKLAVAWYTKSASTEWEVHYRLVSDAHSTRHFSSEMTIHVASEAPNVPEIVFRDFLTLSHQSGNVVIAFSCNWLLITWDPPPCTRDGVSHPMLAKQTGGPKI